MSEKLTIDDVLALFGRGPDQRRWVSYADSEEYLAMVTYVVESLHRR